jgi:hypothetical protein
MKRQLFDLSSPYGNMSVSRNRNLIDLDRLVAEAAMISKSKNYEISKPLKWKRA